jgi:hypothetical protein
MAWDAVDPRRAAPITTVSTVIRDPGIATIIF